MILKLEGQPLLSIADVQWVLQQTPPPGATLKAEVQRGDRKMDLTLKLEKGWRQRENLSWRATSWGLRRMALGGMKLEELSAEGRKKAGLPDTGMALRVEFVGQFGPHAAAKQAGFLKEDILVSFDGRTDLRRETDALAYGVTKHLPGDKVPVTVLRGGKKLNLTLLIQE